MASSNDENCAEMMEALCIEESSQYMGHQPRQSGWKVEVKNEDMADEKLNSSGESSVRPSEEQTMGKVARVSSEESVCTARRYPWAGWRKVRPHPLSRISRRFCPLCGYSAPHRMLLELHLSTCRKTITDRASLLSSYYTSESPDRNEVSVPVAFE